MNPCYMKTVHVTSKTIFSPTDFYKLGWSGRIGRSHRGQRFHMFSLHLSGGLTGFQHIVKTIKQRALCMVQQKPVINEELGFIQFCVPDRSLKYVSKLRKAFFF